jgi:peptidoglycan/xylan/chitin deacetylase (PgdA/CDA1 family)
MPGPLSNRSAAAAFLCYHSIHEDGPEWLSVTPKMFAEQLAALRGAGWRAGTERDLRALAGGSQLDGRTAFLTFDDGFADNFTTALPLLRESGMTAMVFLLPSLLDGAPLDWPEVSAERSLHPDAMRSLTWAQVEEMAEAGIEFGSHGVRHAHLPELGDEELREELLESRRAISERLGSCEMLAYPFGHWDDRVAAAARDAGYSFAFTLPRAHQAGAGPWSIPRISIDRRDRGRRFAIKMSALGRRLYLSRVKSLLRGAG